ncbi:lipopolysaccharide biosynthesis protein [Phenylobacterium sp. VNQ135]|uniref:lipopolysaccharide biosynthesis protein n=1 Tax=Phenylobacterium sp. VNQ135 TaxID=3400922 RepID=UPI003C119BDC
MSRLEQIVAAASRLVSGVGVRGLEVACKFGLFALAAHRLGPAALGIFFLCLTVQSLVSTAGRLGLERPTARHLAADLALARPDLARRTLVQALGLALACGVCCGLVLYAAAEPLAAALRQPDVARPLGITAMSLPFHLVTVVGGYVLIGLDRGGWGQFLMNALPPLLMLAALAVAAALPGGASVELLLWSIVGAQVIAAAWTLGAAAGRWRSARAAAARRTAETLDSEPLPSLLKAARSFYPVELVSAVLASLPGLALAPHVSAAVLGGFSVALRLAMLTTNVVTSLGYMVAARIAADHRRGAYADIRRDMRQVRRAALALCAPPILVMLLAPGPLLGLFNADMPEARLAVQIMALAQLAVAFCAGSDVLLAMSGHGRTLMGLSLAQLALCVLGALLLIPAAGAAGAALTTAAAWIAAAVGQQALARRRTPEIFANG